MDSGIQSAVYRAERFRGLEVDDKLELCRLYQWQVRTL